MTRGCSRFPFVAWRGAIGLIATAVFVAWRISAGRESLTRLGDLDRGARVSLAVAALCGFFLNLAMFIAFDLVTVALALLAFYTYPVVVAVANVALGREALDRARVVALVLAVAGMVAVVASQLDPASGIRLDADRRPPGPRRGGLPGDLRDHQPDRLPCRAGLPGDERRARHDRRLQPGHRHRDRCRRGARLPAPRPVRPAAPGLHRPVRGGHPVDPVPDRHPARRRDAGGHPHAVRAGRRRRAGGVAARRGAGPDPGPRRPGDPGRGADPPAIGRPGRAHGRRAGDRIRRRDGHRPRPPAGPRACPPGSGS